MEEEEKEEKYPFQLGISYDKRDHVGDLILKTDD